MSDAMQMIASPLTTIKRKKWTQDAEALLALIDEHAIGGIVVGYPLNMDGSEGPRCQSVRQFIKNLEKISPVPTHLQDERMSSQAVERTMLEADISRAKRAENVDKLAAAYILQSYLDAQRQN
jgi:putative Holliday junction resolvase